MFKFLRYYSWASLIAVIATALTLVLFYRQVAVQGIVDLAHRNNLTLARAAMNSMKPALLDFLHANGNADPTPTAPASMSPELASTILNLMQDRSVVRIKIYNRSGIVIFSSKHTQIGRDQRDNPGFISAINGRVANTLIYRDSFNPFDGATEEDNLMQSYIPVRASNIAAPDGVLEIYTDVNDLVNQTERVEFIIVFGAILILMLLYSALLLVVRRAGGIIEQQQRAIRVRSESLEILAAQMLRNEESYKRRIAFELHEGLAQTLSAVKLHLENNGNPGSDSESVAALVPALQGAIHDARAIAAELHPSSIDDFGLLLTIDRLCRDLAKQYPQLRIERQIPLKESEIPAPLKVVLYRVIASALAEMAQHTRSELIHLALWRAGATLCLLIDDTTAEALDVTAIPLAKIDPLLRAGFARMEELTTLSGGEFSASHHAAGGTTLRAVWSV